LRVTWELEAPPQIIVSGFFHGDGHHIADRKPLEPFVDEQVAVDLGRAQEFS